MKALGQEQGMVLLVVMVIVALLAALVTEFAYSTLVELRLAETFRDRTRAYYLAKGGIAAGRMILQEDRNGYDGADELWAQGVDGYPVGAGRLAIHIEDLGGRLDINRLVRPLPNRPGRADPDAVFQERFIRLFTLLGLESPEGLTDALIDWLDPDGEPRAGGAEDDYYRTLPTPYRCKNGPLDALDELAAVRGFDRELVRLLAPHVTVHGSEVVNVNTASAAVLSSLAEEMGPASAAGVVARREAQPFARVEELRELPGYKSWYYAIKRHVGVQSATYRIRARARVNDGVRAVEAVVDKAGNRLLCWKVS